MGLIKGKKVHDWAEIVVNPYESNESKLRKGLLIQGPWVDDFEEIIEEHHITALYLNSAHGWKSGDYSFLRRLRSIEELLILSTNSEGLEALESMVKLQELSITTNTTSVVDFTRLPLLKKCFLNWWVGASSIFHSTSLENMYLDEVKLASWADVIFPSSLIKLAIGNSNLDDLSFVKGIPALTRLDLNNCKKIIDFTPLEDLHALKWLTIYGNKNIGDFDFIVHMPDLEVLQISNAGEIKTLRPISNASNLKAFAFDGSTNILDGDLSVLKNLKKLSMLMFTPRKHYTHKLVRVWNWKDFGTPRELLVSKER